jgi:hypothetical protein
MPEGTARRVMLGPDLRRLERKKMHPLAALTVARYLMDERVREADDYRLVRAALKARADQRAREEGSGAASEPEGAPRAQNHRGPPPEVRAGENDQLVTAGDRNE